MDEPTTPATALERQIALMKPMLPELEQRYREPGRHYHNLDHVHARLAEFGAALDLCDAPADMYAAIWFHDCVYDPKRADNEERSADVAADMLTAAGVGRDEVERVRSLVLATKHATAPATDDARVLVDIDLAILGKPEAEFDAYERAIRKEYAHVPDEVFAAGRASILQRLLDRTHIYHTPRFRERYEAAARGNLRRSLARLAATA